MLWRLFARSLFVVSLMSLNIVNLSETLSDHQSHRSYSCWAWRFCHSLCFILESSTWRPQPSLLLFLYTLMANNSSPLFLQESDVFFISHFFKFVYTAVAVEIDRWCRCWLVQRSQGKHLWYGCWRFPALKQMDWANLGTMCMEIFSPMQGCNSCWIKWSFCNSFWLWKGVLLSSLLGWVGQTSFKNMFFFISKKAWLTCIWYVNTWLGFAQWESRA